MVHFGTKRMATALILVVLVSLLWCCAGIGVEATDGDAIEDAFSRGEPETGFEFSLLTYNVAGLPDLISGSSPARNTTVISSLLNPYNLVLVQEDFWYHDDLVADAGHPYRSDPIVQRPTLLRIGDGLNRLSNYRFGSLARVTWRQCNGFLRASSDCLAQKGFSVALTELAPGAPVYIYNLHMDAGGDDEDMSVRRLQAEQLAADILIRVGTHAVIVAGDTNLKSSRTNDRATLDWLLSTLSLSDVCRALGCGDERIDRVMFRSGAKVILEPLAWETPGGFVDDDGVDLSDHEPVAVRFRWEPKDPG